MKRGSDFIIPFEARNEYGGLIDLTGASIYFTLKADPDSTSILITKENTAGGGSDSEIEVISAANGLGIVKILRTDTLSLTNRNYYYDIFVDNAEDSVVINNILKLEKTVKGSGGTIVPTALDNGKAIWFKNINGTLTTEIASGWTSNPTAAWDGTTLTMTSSGSEFTDAMITDSSLTGQFVLTSQGASTRVMDFNTTSGTYWIYIYEVTA